MLDGGTGGTGGRGREAVSGSCVDNRDSLASLSLSTSRYIPRLGGLYLLFDGRDCQCVSAV